MAQAAKDLQKAIIDHTVVIIGTCTEAEFAERIKPAGSLAEHVRTLIVPPANADETNGVLSVLKPQIERDYELTIKEDALKTAQQLSARYVGAEPQPASAVQVVHRACAMRKTSEVALQARRSCVDAEAVMRAVSVMTGIPTNKLGADERAKFAQIEDALRQRVLGQDDAIKALARAVKSARGGSQRPKAADRLIFVSWPKRRRQDRAGANRWPSFCLARKRRWLPSTCPSIKKMTRSTG